MDSKTKGGNIVTADKIYSKRFAFRHPTLTIIQKCDMSVIDKLHDMLQRYVQAILVKNDSKKCYYKLYTV